MPSLDVLVLVLMRDVTITSLFSFQNKTATHSFDDIGWIMMMIIAVVEPEAFEDVGVTTI